MALIVEDGTAKSDAESFCTVAFADSYHSNRGNSSWAAIATEAEKEALLRKATDYMEEVYRLRWLGYRATESQALSWPRDEVQRRDFTYLNQFSFYPNDQVPTEIQKACAELAIKANSETLAPDIGRVKERSKVGPIDVTYEKGSPPYKRFRAVDNILAPFLDSGSIGTFRNVVVG